MNTTDRAGQASSPTGGIDRHSRPFIRTRYTLIGLVTGLILAGWATSGPDRYGEADGIFGTMRGTYRTVLKGFRYTAASVRDCSAKTPFSVRNLGLGQQIETRLCQDKRLDAQGIIVQVEEDGTAVLRGLVPDASHKEKAMTLTRDTRGVERVVDHLAVSPTPRVINTPAGGSVPTDVATQPLTVR